MSAPDRPARAAIDAALFQASDENSLGAHYRDIVRPLLRQAREQWPSCCGSSCEPCSLQLIGVATRTLELLGIDGPIPED